MDLGMSCQLVADEGVGGGVEGVIVIVVVVTLFGGLMVARVVLALRRRHHRVTVAPLRGSGRLPMLPESADGLLADTAGRDIKGRLEFLQPPVQALPVVDVAALVVLDDGVFRANRVVTNVACRAVRATILCGADCAVAIERLRVGVGHFYFSFEVGYLECEISKCTVFPFLAGSLGKLWNAG